MVRRVRVKGINLKIIKNNYIKNDDSANIMGITFRLKSDPFYVHVDSAETVKTNAELCKLIQT